ncbi:MAG TPA: hypothetical protein DE061_04965, partial [Clostridiales bacterium]|nr:hypothetical protein [Clostridiales bacterium]
MRKSEFFVKIKPLIHVEKSAKKRRFFAVFCVFFICFFALTFCVFSDGKYAYAAEKSQEEIEKEFNSTVDEVIDGLDLKALQEFLDSLGQEESEA